MKSFNKTRYLHITTRQLFISIFSCRLIKTKAVFVNCTFYKRILTAPRTIVPTGQYTDISIHRYRYTELVFSSLYYGAPSHSNIKQSVCVVYNQTLPSERNKFNKYGTCQAHCIPRSRQHSKRYTNSNGGSADVHVTHLLDCLESNLKKNGKNRNSYEVQRGVLQFTEVPKRGAVVQQ